MPLSAVTGRAEIMDAAHAGGLGGTYGGNPVACAAALATIRVIEEEDLLVRARQIGDILVERLTAMQQSDARIGDIRGHGAMIAAEIVDPATGEPDPATTSALAAACAAQGVVMLTCGTFGNVIRFLPPLAICDELLNDGLDVIAHELQKI
ncbi:4-aminobutyrate aminotransferase-like enzyme [Microbacterium amylolyticum]|uniref:4-aminobutyrate aminotransferase-like enzyme n=1 Tax=Microbacterium amylolyticum TaxID=936337 RepID=A0ABS4ZJL8_9MICO|nr:4-aminobutyrate aminotransferase-like enzyme [Microbacterium amylolyticum]